VKENHSISVSVICPTYNAENFISKTIESVINQTRSVSELIVVDDGSSDKTVSVVRKIFSNCDKAIRTKLICNDHKGPGHARNSGIRIAKSEWIAFLDSDDIWHKKKIEEVFNEISIEENSDINFLCHNEERINIQKSISIINCSERYKSSSTLKKQLFWTNLFSTSAVVCKRDLLLKYGLFDENLLSIQDYELWLRLSNHINVKFLNGVLGSYIERRGNITYGNTIKRFTNEFKVLMKYRQGIPVHKVILRIIKLCLSHSLQFAKKIRSRLW